MRGRTGCIFSVRVPSSLYAHVGGQLAFGPGGRLHASIGDGLEPAAAQDPEQRAGQDPAPGRRPDRSLRRSWWRSASATRGASRSTGTRAISSSATWGSVRFEEINVIRRGTRGVPNFGWGAEPPPPDAMPAFVRVRPSGPRLRSRHRRLRLPRPRAPAPRVGATSTGTRARAACGAFAPAAASPRPRKEPFTVGQLASFGEDAARRAATSVARGDGGVPKLTRDDAREHAMTSPHDRARVDLAAAAGDPRAAADPVRIVPPPYEEVGDDPVEHAVGKARSVDGGESTRARRRHGGRAGRRRAGQAGRTRRGPFDARTSLGANARGRLRDLPAHGRLGRGGPRSDGGDFRQLTARRGRRLRRERRMGGPCGRVRDPGLRRLARRADRGRLPERRRASGRAVAGRTEPDPEDARLDSAAPDGHLRQPHRLRQPRHGRRPGHGEHARVRPRPRHRPLRAVGRRHRHRARARCTPSASRRSGCSAARRARSRPSAR